ncbi:hypothetical protein HK098_008237 [Nowakowskiella sp. JEL0407]|nr:hypothetical protein HK098_008237 [Nowakowskiella sp. JEL0407]
MSTKPEHSLVIKSYVTPTLCSVCHLFLVGLIRQGLQCEICHLNFHHRCAVTSDLPCAAPTLSNDYVPVLDLENIYNSSDRQNSKDRTSSRRLSESTPLSSVDPFTSLPQLSLLTTSKNFSRFITRIGPLVNLHDIVVDLICWKNSANTGAFLIWFIFLCLNPSLLFILPNLLLLYVIISNYYLKTSNLTPNTLLPSSSSSDLTTQASEVSRNLQFIQHTMGLYVEIYDWCGELYQYVDWTNEQTTRALLKFLCVSGLSLYIFFRLIPLNWIILSVGTSVVLGNSQDVKNVVWSVLQLSNDKIDSIHQALNEKDYKGVVNGIFEVAKDAGSILKNETMVKSISVCENQRWWAGLEWIPHLHKFERDKWSDASGSTSYPPKELITIPVTDGSDLEWEWFGDWKLEIKNGKTDQDGWIYTDNMAESFSEESIQFVHKKKVLDSKHKSQA